MDGGDGNKFRALFRIKIVQIRDVLEVVGVNFTFVCCGVRLDVVVKHGDLQIDVLLCQDRLADFENFSVWRSCGRDFQDLRLGSVRFLRLLFPASVASGLASVSPASVEASLAAAVGISVFSAGLVPLHAEQADARTSVNNRLSTFFMFFSFSFVICGALYRNKVF